MTAFMTGNKNGVPAVLQAGDWKAARNTRVPGAVTRERFEQAVLPHLDAAYSLARWLTRNDQDAQDVTQESFLRAFRFFDGYQGGNMRAWLLTIVRNT
jgi:DNA-directed RNA polymerase specialized sigma24 family protein